MSFDERSYTIQRTRGNRSHPPQYVITDPYGQRIGNPFDIEADALEELARLHRRAKARSEPWSPWDPYPDSSVKFVELAMDDYRRGAICVNACEGIEDPAKALRLAREALRRSAYPCQWCKGTGRVWDQEDDDGYCHCNSCKGISTETACCAALAALTPADHEETTDAE